MKSTKLLLSVAALSAGLIISGGTRAEDWKPVGQAGFLGVGKAYEIEKGHIYWVGEFSGTFFNDKEKGLFDHAGVKCPAWDDIDLNNKKEKGGGYCVITDLDGDQAYLTWQNAGRAARRLHDLPCTRELIVDLVVCNRGAQHSRQNAVR
jgi:hypothetical protein